MKLPGSKILATFITSAFIALSVFGLFMMAGHMSHGAMPMSDCPFMAGQHALCPMDFSSHIAAWQELVRALIPALMLLIIIGVVFIIYSVQLKEGKSVFLRRRPERQFFLYTELFSSGILNPKIP